jgi:hypothetical protein
MNNIIYICSLCNNKKQDELNIEASIHHSRPVVCFDKKQCKRTAKKKKL